MTDQIQALLATWRAKAQRWDRSGDRHLAAVLQAHADELSTAIDAGGWQPIETAPIDGKFLVCDSSGRIMVADGHMYSLSIMPGVPEHLSGHHWTHWMPMPPGLVRS